MATKRIKNIKRRKQQNCCQFCGKLVSNVDVIHKKCAFDYLESTGYAMLDFNLKRILFGEDGTS